MDCHFCNLDTDRNPIIKEGKYTYVTLSNPKLVDGHLLIIPKRHVERIAQLDEEERKELLEMIIEFQEKIINKFSQGCDIHQHYRPYEPQDNYKVDHIHIHLQPREKGDALSIYEDPKKILFQYLTPEEKEKYIHLFKD
jgi:diadenosine tetraphosphate (Ap4A) HIT family hydrolase